MKHPHAARAGLCAIAISLFLSACGGSSSAPADPQGAAIQGIAVPSSVAVVTATHAE
jgi:hypothetical protein